MFKISKTFHRLHSFTLACDVSEPAIKAAAALQEVLICQHTRFLIHVLHM